MKKIIFEIAIVVCIILIILFFINFNNDDNSSNNTTNPITNEEGNYENISEIKEENNKAYVYTAKAPNEHKEIDNENVQEILSIVNELNFEESTSENYMKTYFISFENGNVYALDTEEKIIIKNDNEVAKVSEDKFETLLNIAKNTMSGEEE